MVPVEEQLYLELIEKIKTYHPSSDFSMVEKAYKLAVDAHKDQKRKSGEPYIIHPLKVAYILAELELDMESIVAGILHDVIEDTEYSYEDISNMFSEEIAALVDGVTKLGKLSYTTKEEVQAENYRKMFLAMAKDIRVILIKLADRLHNMRTLNYMKPEKQKEKAQETLDIYAPLAHRLGISKIRSEMEDLCFKYLDPDAFFDLATKIERKKEERDEFVQDIVKELQQKIDYQFKDENLLFTALTHSSYANEHKLHKIHHNERLEFLGDAVLEVVSSDFLFKNFPDMAEGQMSKKRASLVCEPTLAYCARQIGLGKYLMLGKGEDMGGGRNRDSILSDALEAVIGSIYLDGGIEQAGSFIMTHVLNDIEHKAMFQDSKTILQELLQKDHKDPITYEVVDMTGPEHNRLFVIQVKLGDRVIGKGSGRTKQAAGQEAAYHAILALKNKQEH